MWFFQSKMNFDILKYCAVLFSVTCKNTELIMI